MGPRSRVYRLSRPALVSACSSKSQGIAHIVELVSVLGPLGIDDSFAVSFVAKVATMVLQIVFDLLFDRQIKYALTDLEEVFGVIEQLFAIDIDIELHGPSGFGLHIIIIIATSRVDSIVFSIVILGLSLPFGWFKVAYFG